LKKILLLSWAYLSELLLAFLIVVFSSFTLEKHNNIIVFLFGKTDLIVGGVIAILCAKIGVFIYHMTLTATEFGNYLSYVRADYNYKNSFLYSIIMDIVCIAVIIGWAVTKEVLIFRFALFFVAITVLTLLTTLQNIFEIVRFNNAFNRKIKQLDSGENG